MILHNYLPGRSAGSISGHCRSQGLAHDPSLVLLGIYCEFRPVIAIWAWTMCRVLPPSDLEELDEVLLGSGEGHAPELDPAFTRGAAHAAHAAHHAAHHHGLLHAWVHWGHPHARHHCEPGTGLGATAPSHHSLCRGANPYAAAGAAVLWG